MSPNRAWTILLVGGGFLLAGAGFHYEARWLIAAGWLAAVFGAGMAILRSRRDRILRDDVKTSHSLGYRLEMAFWWIVGGTWTLGGLLLALGFFSRSSAR